MGLDGAGVAGRLDIYDTRCDHRFWIRIGAGEASYAPAGACSMGMFETTGRTGEGAHKTTHTGGSETRPFEKLERMRKALQHQEPDRVPISDFFWGGFLQRWRQELALPPDADPYYHYDLDWIVTTPNMDPHLRAFEILQENANQGWGKTGLRA